MTCVHLLLFFSEYNRTMATVRFPAVMKYYVNNQAELSVSAATVQELIEQIVEQYLVDEMIPNVVPSGSV